MSVIRLLDKRLASKIAAGEAVERPESVLKELLENSLDAGARSITIQVAEGGKRLIKVVDDGCGMSSCDALMAFMRHATSKISTEEDLERISTMGFRGEALASISAVSRVTLTTRRREDVSGTVVAVEGGGEPVASAAGCPEGTAVEVRDLFYNLPARLKFMRGAETEYGRLLETFKKIALANPGVRFRLSHGSARPVESAPGDLMERITDLFGPEVGRGLVELSGDELTGLIGSHELSYPTSKYVFTYVNGRWVRDKAINRAIIEGYGQLLSSGRYPFAALFLRTPPEDVDVNIHPAKSEVRFKNPKYIYDLVRFGVGRALGGAHSRGASQAAARSMAAPIGADIKNRAMEAGAGWPGDRPSPAEAPSLGFARIEVPEALNPEFLGLRIVGQLWGEFLVAESAEGVAYLIDQHGAAERCAFERLKKAYFSDKVRSQALLLPERIDATPDESEALKKAMEALSRMGFELEPFGPSASGGESYLIRSVPDVISSMSARQLIKDLAEELSGMGGSSRLDERIEASLMRVACHSVIRGRRPLNAEEGQALLKELSKVDFSGHCPHGRPVVKRITRGEIESAFKR